MDDFYEIFKWVIIDRGVGRLVCKEEMLPIALSGKDKGRAAKRFDAIFKKAVSDGILMAPKRDVLGVMKSPKGDFAVTAWEIIALPE